MRICAILIVHPLHFQQATNTEERVTILDIAVAYSDHNSGFIRIHVSQQYFILKTRLTT
jgi:hypothetical protein